MCTTIQKWNQSFIRKVHDAKMSSRETKSLSVMRRPRNVTAVVFLQSIKPVYVYPDGKSKLYVAQIPSLSPHTSVITFLDLHFEARIETLETTLQGI